MEGFAPNVPRLVIPAKAGIQVCSPPQLAWIPAFAGMTGTLRLLSVFRVLYEIIQAVVILTFVRFMPSW
jgi:hypothetical protein